MPSLSREFLIALGVPEAAITPICERHTEITSSINDKVEGWKKKYEEAKAQADKVPELQKEIDGLKGGEDWKSKYEQEHQAFEDHKAELAKKEMAKKVETAYRKMLTDKHIKSDRIDFIVAHTDLSKAALAKDGESLENAADFEKEITDPVNGWGGYIVTTEKAKASVANPPAGGTGSGTSRARELYIAHMKQQGINVEDAGKE